MRIKVGDTTLDAYRDEVIAQNYSVNQLGDIVTRQGSYSNDFELPLTAKNREALGFPEDINSNSRKPYQRVSATLIDQGTPIAEGYLKYSATANNNLRCSFFATNVEWFGLIKNKKLTDIDLSEFDHEWTIENIQAAILADKTSGYTYPLIDYGEFGSISPASFSIDVNGDQMYPAMFVNTIIEKMFFDIGWKVEGEMINHPLYKRMIIPFSAKKFVNDESFIEDNTQVLNMSSDQNDTRHWDNDAIIDFPVTWSTGDSEVTIAKPGDYKIDVIVELDAFFTKGVTTVINDALLYPIIVKVNSVAVASLKGIDILNNSSGTNQYTINSKYTLTTNQYLEAGDTVEVIYRVEIDMGIGGDFDMDTDVESDTTSLVIAPSSESIAYGQTITMSSTLPDITQEDFMKYLVFLFGAIPQPNNNSKTINFGLFNSIKNNTPNAMDWSNKIDLSKTQELDFTELLQNYGQVSIITYAEDENDAELSAYEAETGKRLGEGQFEIENEHLASRKVIYEAPFSPMININSFDNSFYVPQIRFKAQSVDDDDVEPTPKIAILSENININTLSGGLFNFLVINNPNTVDSEAVSSMPFCWFVKTTFISEVDELLDSLAFDQVRFTNAVGDPIIDRFLVDYEDILNSLKYYKAYFHLTETDIANLDFTVPIFVDKLKSYFYISNIKNYKGSEQTTECELVKITKSVEDLQVLTPDNVFVDNDLLEFIDNDGESFIDL